MPEYRRYIGEVSLDHEAHVLHAHAINGGPYLIAKAADAASLEREFQRSVDGCLEGCTELQIGPVASAPGAASNPQPA